MHKRCQFLINHEANSEGGHLVRHHDKAASEKPNVGLNSNQRSHNYSVNPTAGVGTPPEITHEFDE